MKNLKYTCLSIIMMMVVGISSSFAQAVVCNDGLNVTLDYDCEAVLVADDLLEGEFCPTNSTIGSCVPTITATLWKKGEHVVEDFNNPDLLSGRSVVVKTPGKYKYTIEVNGKSCWGYFNVEDKTAPQPVCAPFLPTEVLSCTTENVEDYFKNIGVQHFTDCSKIDRVESEVIKISNSCFPQPPPTAYSIPDGWVLCDLYVKNWRAIDWSGLTSQPISQFIIIIRPGIDLIELDDKFEAECGTELPQGRPYFIDLVLDSTDVAFDDCTANSLSLRFPQNASEVVKVEITEGETTCKYSASYHQDPFIPTCYEAGEDCKETGKYFRHWTVVDWCTGEKIYDEKTQVYEIVDTQAPIFISSEETAWTSPYECTASMTGTFTAVDGCAAIVAYETVASYNYDSHEGGAYDRVVSNTNSVTITKVPVGATVHFEYRAWDCCGNLLFQKAVLEANDDYKPVCIANDELHVALVPVHHDTASYLGARVYPEDLDDTSRDNCQKISMMVRESHDDAWAPYVQWLLSESDQCTYERWVELLVFEDPDWDGAFVDNNNDGYPDGHYSTCATKIILTDDNAPMVNNIPTEVVSCKVNPETVFSNVEEGFSGGCIEVTGSKTYKHPITCPFTFEGDFSPSNISPAFYKLMDQERGRRGSKDTRYDGAFMKEWYLSKTTEHRTYRDTVRQLVLTLLENDVTFVMPFDYKINCTSAEDIPAPATLEEILTNKGCEEWLMNVGEETFLGDEEACMKILRTYTFINWCRIDESEYENEGYDRTDVVDKDGAAYDIYGRRYYKVHKHDSEGYETENLVTIAYPTDNGDVVAPYTAADLADYIGQEKQSVVAYERYDGGDRLFFTGTLNDAGEPLFSYEREYLDADTNHDGKITEDECPVILKFGGDKESEKNDAKQLADGYFQYVQIIKIDDSKKPTGNLKIKTQCDTNLPGCDQGAVTIDVFMDDECSTASLTSILVTNTVGDTIDLVSTDVNSFVAAAGLATDTYTVSARISDDCGNFEWLTESFEIGAECKQPTPIAVLTFTAVMENGCVEVWASDIEQSSYDNCTPSDSLIFKVGKKEQLEYAGDAVEFCCKNTPLGTQLVYFFVIDQAGNYRSIQVPIDLQNNNGADCIKNAETAALVGNITNEEGEEIDDVMVSVSGTGLNPVAQLFNGYFNLNVPMQSDATIITEKDINHSNGVSTADLVILQRHILGITPLSSAYQYIAADASNDSKVDTRDILHISRMILGITNAFPNNQSWRFVDAAHQFNNPAQPWGFPEAVNFYNLDNDAQADFVGVKVGDLTGNARPNQLIGESELVGAESMVVAIEDATIQAGETFTIDFKASDYNFAGFQFTIDLGGAIQFESVVPGIEEMTAGNFGLTHLENGVITTSFASAEAIKIADETVLFSITATALEAVTLSSAIQLNSEVTTAEAYNENLDVYGVEASFNIVGSNFELFQNAPNPVKSETIIGFNLPEAGTATMRLFDVAGKTLKVITADYARGYNEVTINKSDLGTAGVLYYQLDTDSDSATKKMVIIE